MISNTNIINVIMQLFLMATVSGRGFKTATSGRNVPPGAMPAIWMSPDCLSFGASAAVAAQDGRCFNLVVQRLSKEPMQLENANAERSADPLRMGAKVSGYHQPPAELGHQPCVRPSIRCYLRATRHEQRSAGSVQYRLSSSRPCEPADDHTLWLRGWRSGISARRFTSIRR